MTDRDEEASDTAKVDVLDDADADAAAMEDAHRVESDVRDAEDSDAGVDQADGETPEDGSDDRTAGGTNSATPAADRMDARAAVEEDFYDAMESVGRPAITAEELARTTDRSHAAAEDALADLPVATKLSLSADAVYYPEDLSGLVDRERVVVFPDRREIVVHHPEQFTLARLSSFARLVTTNGEGGYVYEVRDADVWAAPHDDLGDLMVTIRSVAGRWPSLEEFVESQWKRARKFTLRSEADYTVLVAASDDLMGNVAMQKLTEGEHVRGLISDTEAWVVEGEEAEIKRLLYDAGYPVRDDRDLDTGAVLPVSLATELRDYQLNWVDRFTTQGSGVLVGPPGSGKTVATMGIMAAIEGETLILVPSRELAGQWRAELLDKTSLEPDQVGEYHGGTKEMQPVTIATYQTAGMDRHRHLFDSRRWGLIVYDEVQHIVAPVFRRSVDLQGKARLGLSATPLREDDRETEIYTLIGPPIGTDWTALFEAGFVARPAVEIRYVPWASEDARQEYDVASGHDRRRVAAMNPAKIPAVRRILEAHSDQKALVFVDWLDQGEAIAQALGVPFVSGETRHARRAHLFEAFRQGDRDCLVISRVGDEGIDLPDAELAIVASGLGGSRRQGTQRAGRTMRPVGRSQLYVLATPGTEEEEFARQRMRHLASKGVRIHEVEAAAPDGEDADEGADR